MKRVPIFLVMVVIGIAFTILTVYYSEGTAKRGEAPLCQQECLQEHERQVARLAEEYAGKKHKPDYQDKLQQAVKDYWTCTENCREPLPVK